MKKILAVLISTLLVLTLFAACGQASTPAGDGAPASGEKTTVNF